MRLQLIPGSTCPVPEEVCYELTYFLCNKLHFLRGPHASRRYHSPQVLCTVYLHPTTDCTLVVYNVVCWVSKRKWKKIITSFEQQQQQLPVDLFKGDCMLPLRFLVIICIQSVGVTRMICFVCMSFGNCFLGFLTNSASVSY